MWCAMHCWHPSSRQGRAKAYLLASMPLRTEELLGAELPAGSAGIPQCILHDALRLMSSLAEAVTKSTELCHTQWPSF